jgi:hypothetical protein
MISKETMRIVLLAARFHLSHRTRNVCLIEEQIRRDSVGDQTPVFLRSVRPVDELQDAQKRVAEIEIAIDELRSTEVGAEAWKELDDHVTIETLIVPVPNTGTYSAPTTVSLDVASALNTSE